MKKIIFVSIVLLIILTFLVGCTSEEVPIEIQKEIQERYSNINSYSAVVQNRLGGSKFKVDQEWELSMEKPDKYRRSVTMITDSPYEGHSEICVGDKMYTLSEGQKSEINFNCAALVSTNLDMFSQLQHFSDKETYKSSAVYEDGDIKITIIHIESSGKSQVFVDPNNYLIKKVRYITSQAIGSDTVREEIYKDIKLNENFDPNEFKPYS
ncbi:hypothetical protein KY334_01875 [Candidatus Woesearchaeota archaeon]|nr:hypothetical protein [Candidatus Woesearchaeota archaeon]